MQGDNSLPPTNQPTNSTGFQPTQQQALGAQTGYSLPSQAQEAQHVFSPPSYTPAATPNSPAIQPFIGYSTAPQPSVNPIPQTASFPQQSSDMRYEAAFKGPRRFPLVLMLICLIVLALSGGIILFVRSRAIQPVTKLTIESAATTLVAVNQDTTGAWTSSTLIGIGSYSDAATISKAVATDLAKLHDAQAKLNMLARAQVVQSASIRNPYQAYQTKEQAFIKYLTTDLQEYSIIGPVATNLANQLDATSNFPSSASDIPAYLNTIRGIIASANQGINSVKPTEANNQATIASITAYTQAMSQVVAKIQQDYTSGQSIFTMDNDWTDGSLNASQAFTSQITKIQDDASTYQQQLFPTNEYEQLAQALDLLETKFS